jgi:hypothetical protein
MDLRSRVGEVSIEIEYVLVPDILAERSLLQYFLVPAGQTLQSSAKLFFLCGMIRYVNSRVLKAAQTKPKNSPIRV